jgi:Uma2 family endonuclease
MAEAAERLWSPEEYLAWERQQPTKHEYIDGVIVAMAGASLEHNTIVANVLGELRSALREKPCRVLASDMRVKIPKARRYRYPDASIACDPIAYEDEAADTLLNPIVIVEVLSDSTEREDRRDKFREYRSIPSFREYLLVAQDEPRVEHYVRQESGLWTYRDTGAGDIVTLASCDVELRVDELYLKVFPRPSPSR